MASDWVAIVVAGIAGTLVLTAVMLVGSAAGLGRLNFPMLLGTVFAPPGPQALVLGLGWHVLNGIAFAFAYALAVGGLGLGADWTTGLALGVPHAGIAGVLLALVSSLHPRIRRGHMPAPGPFGSRYGVRGLLVLLLAHLGYGAAVGALL